jgi:hypothetical protein
VAVAARLEFLPAEQDRRSGDRYALRLEAIGSPSPDDRVLIHNLSPGGMLIETTVKLPIGGKLELSFDESASDAIIVWNTGSYYGCSFERPISRASLSAALLRSEALSPSNAVDEQQSSIRRSIRLWVVVVLSLAAWALAILLLRWMA